MLGKISGNLNKYLGGAKLMEINILGGANFNVNVDQHLKGRRKKLNLTIADAWREKGFSRKKELIVTPFVFNILYFLMISSSQKKTGCSVIQEKEKYSN